MVFIVWLACHPDNAAGFDVDEKQATSRIIFWNQFVAFMNVLLSSDYGHLDNSADETCFSDMSYYDKRETGNRLALCQDFELRGFLPLVQAHSILDFSRKHAAGNDGTSKEMGARVQRIVAMTLMNCVRIDQREIYFDQHLKKFVFGNNPSAIVDNELAGLMNAPEPSFLNNATSVGSLSNLGGQQSVATGFESTTVKPSLYFDGDDEEQIFFKLTLSEKHPHAISSGSTYEAVQPLHVSSAGDLTGVIIPSPFDSVAPHGMVSNVLPWRNLTSLPAISKKNPDGSMNNSAAKEQNFNVDEYSWLDQSCILILSMIVAMDFEIKAMFALPTTSGTMFLNCTYHCQRALAAPFSKQHASSSHANQGSACFSHHESPEAVPRSKGQALFLLTLGPSSGRQSSIGPGLVYVLFFRKTRTKLCNPSPTNTSEQSSSKEGGIEHPGSTDQKRRTRPRKSRILPLSPLVKQELENKKNSLSPSFSLSLL
ncbi:Protein SMG7 [Apostasia shenzhenica]|uniref:Protein SMG7 n=1 Tax=Apostasia shenzhenica TaxID=1088818 RepID=A0A2I0AUF6_9ASPA|nr:Protein SMG7 [Apostasia shenzhenica]